MSEADMDSPYKHLVPTKRQFRILRLLEFGSDRLKCELRIFLLLEEDLLPCKAL
jgi:hypothetical protein